MRWLPWVGRASQRRRNRAAWNPIRRVAGLVGGGGPAGPHAHGRAILSGPAVDINWAAACWAWDQLRADVRKLDERTQAVAWQVTEAAMRELHRHINTVFGDLPNLDEKEVYRVVDR